MKRFLKSPWVISIGSGLVILFFTHITKAITIEKIVKILSNIFNWMKDLLISFLNYEVKVWWILCTIIFLCVVLFICLKIQSNKTEKEPDFLSYKTDEICNWLWKWRWVQKYNGKYQIEKLEPICPQCQTPLSFDYFKYSCLRCNYNTRNNIPEFYDIEKIILDNVERNLYKKVGKE